MAITVGGTPSFKTGSGAGSGAVTEMASAASGDVFVAVIVVDAAATGLARPSGWTNLKNGTTATQFDYDISYIVRGGSAPSLTWAWTGSLAYEVHIVRFIGVDNVTPIDAQGTLASGNGRMDTAVDPPAVVAVALNTMAVALCAHWTGSATPGWTAPTGYTRQSDNTLGNDCAIATKLLSAAGSEDPSVFSGNASNIADWIAHTITLDPAGAGGGTLSALLVEPTPPISVIS